MKIEEEIEKIKERLENLENLINGGGETLHNHENHDPPFELIDLQVKKSESNSGPEYSYRLEVKNLSESPITLAGCIILVDSQEFEVDRHMMSPFTIQSKEVSQQIGKVTIFDENHVSRIADVTAEINLI